jgi:hypothetical protein
MDPHERGIRFEMSDASPRLLGGLALGLVAGIAATLLLIGVSFPAVLTNVGHASGRETSPPEPRLQIDPQQDLAALRQQEQQRLSGYGWVDRERGLARIPVERAMEDIARRGLPGWPHP